MSAFTPFRQGNLTGIAVPRSILPDGPLSTLDDPDLPGGSRHRKRQVWILCLTSGFYKKGLRFLFPHLPLAFVHINAATAHCYQRFTAPL